MTNDEQIRILQKFGVMPTGLVEYSTATLSDGLQKIGLKGRVLERAIRPLLPFQKMAGTAVTLKVADAAGQPSSYSKLVAYAMEAGAKVSAPVLVLEQPDIPGATVVGSGGAHVMRDRFGFVGCLIEGAVRDTDDLKRMNFPVYSRTVHPEYIFGILKGVSFNQPVVVGGVEISPGDVIVGDNDGVVAIPPAHLAKVLEAANETLAEERKILNEIDAGEPYLEVLRRYQPEAFQGDK